MSYSVHRFSFSTLFSSVSINHYTSFVCLFKIQKKLQHLFSGRLVYLFYKVNFFSSLQAVALDPKFSRPGSGKQFITGSDRVCNLTHCLREKGDSCVKSMEVREFSSLRVIMADFPCDVFSNRQ